MNDETELNVGRTATELPISRDLLLKEITHIDAVLEVLASMQLSVLDKVTAARVRLQLLNKKLSEKKP